MAPPMDFEICLPQFQKAALSGLQKLPTEECVSFVLRKSLGYAVVAGSSMLKLPQIYNVLSSGSAKGLAPAALESTVLGFTIVLAYCLQSMLPFSTYGEAVFLLIQDLLLLGLVYSYSKTHALRVQVLSGLYLLFVGCIMKGFITRQMVSWLYDAHILVFIFARLPQIYQSWAAGSTGELSIISCGLLLAGNAVRIFTSRTEGSTSMLVGHLIGGSLNLIILLQILYYLPRDKAAAEQKKAVKKAKKAD